MVGLGALLVGIALAPGSLVERFEAGERWHPSAKEVEIAKHLSDSRNVERQGAGIYVLALASPQNPTYVPRLVGLRLCKPADHQGSVEKVTEALGDALKALYLAGNHQALKYILTLDLDGAAGEMISDARSEILDDNLPKVCNLWATLRGKDRALLPRELIDEDDIKGSRAYANRLLKSKQKSIQSLGRAILLYIRSQSIKSMS